MKPDINMGEMAGIQSPADFYGWKKHILDALRKKEIYDLAGELERETSLLAFYQRKGEILEALGLSEKKEKTED